MGLANLRLVYKVMLLVAIMGLMTGIVGFVGYSNVSRLATAAVEIDTADGFALRAERMNQAVLGLSRAEYRAGFDPSAATMADIEKNVGQRKVQFEEGLTALRAGATEDEKASLNKLEADFLLYFQSVGGTLAKVREHHDTAQMDEGRKAIADSVVAGRALSAALQASVKTVTDHYDDKGNIIVDKSEKAADAARIMVVGGSLAGIVVGLAIGFVLGNYGISAPIGKAVEALQSLAAGNVNITIFGVGRKDEIGDIGRAVQVFKDTAIRVAQLTQDQEEAKRRAEADRKAAMSKMADSFEASVGKVIETVTSAATELQAASGQMAGTATETSSQATTVASAAQQASGNVETVASATEELSASIKEIALQVERSQAVSVRAIQEADSTTSHVRELSVAVSKIGEVVNLINDIASQTNLLALNATIEAARAGDAGKGFAVVANEVKNLANQTGKATSEIAGQIKAVQDGTNAAVHAIDSISKVIGEMGQISSAVAAAVEEQFAATTEIARNVEQAAAGTQEVTNNIISVEQAARETGAAAEQIKMSSTDLSRQAEVLGSEVDRFLAEIRSDSKDMTLMHWASSYEIGVAAIDQHHRALFDQVNGFYRQMMAGDGGQAANAILSELDRRMRPHFEEEEALMRKHHFADAAHHIASHKAFFDHITPLRRGVEENRPDAVPQLFNYIATWLQQHIAADDKILAQFLQAKRVA